MVLNGLSKQHSSGGGINIPTYIDHTTNSVLLNQTYITLTKPDNVNIGDLLVIAVMNDSIQSIPQWDDTNYKPTGFTFIDTDGDGVSDSHYGVFYKIADGTEGATVDVSYNFDGIYRDQIGFYMHFKGVDDLSPIGNVGLSAIESGTSGNTVTAPGIPGNSGDLGLLIMAFDGGDGHPLTVDGSWGDVIESVGAGGVSGMVGLKTYTDTVSDDCLCTASVSDGRIAMQFRIAAP